MIHYTLLPEKEMRTLKREYRTRLVIFLSFFVSIAILIGIVSLAPAYIFSHTEEAEVIRSIEALERDRQDRGADIVMQDLKETGDVVKKLKGYNDSVIFSQIVSQVISLKPVSIKINSFNMPSVVPAKKTSGSSATTTPTLEVIIQGKSPTREDLVAFRDNLEADPLVTSVDLPVSNLAKSRDISFSLKILLLKTQ